MHIYCLQNDLCQVRICRVTYSNTEHSDSKEPHNKSDRSRNIVVRTHDPAHAMLTPKSTTPARPASLVWTIAAVLGRGSHVGLWTHCMPTRGVVCMCYGECYTIHLAICGNLTACGKIMESQLSTEETKHAQSFAASIVQDHVFHVLRNNRYFATHVRTSSRSPPAILRVYVSIRTCNVARYVSLCLVSLCMRQQTHKGRKEV